MAELIFTDKELVGERMGIVLNHLSMLQRQTVLDSIVTYRFKKDDLVYVEDTTPNDCMFMLEGKVKIYQSGIGNRDQILRLIACGELFGYDAHFAKRNYVTRAAALEPSVICFIPMETIDELAQSNLSFANELLRTVSRNLMFDDERIISLTQKRVRARLAEALLMIRDAYGMQADGKTLCLNPSRKDLADMSNMLTNNAIRTLSAFVDENIVEVDRRKIKIIDIDKLTNISDN